MNVCHDCGKRMTHRLSNLNWCINCRERRRAAIRQEELRKRLGCPPDCSHCAATTA